MLPTIKHWIGRLALVAIGLVLLAAGVLKALDPEGFASQVEGYEIVPAGAAMAVAYALITLEVALGVALLVDWKRRWTVGAAVVLLVGFLGLMSYTWATGGNVSECGCFGRFAKRTPLETILEDVGFIVLALAGLLARRREPDGGGGRLAAVGVAALAALAFLPLAPSLPLDDIVTGLKPGMAFEDLNLSLPDAAFSKGTHLVALLALEEEASGEAADKLGELAAQPGAPAVAVLYADDEEVKDAFFWSHAPSYPMYQVIHEEMRALYRRLPRFFLVEDGVVTKVWETMPEQETVLASARAGM